MFIRNLFPCRYLISWTRSTCFSFQLINVFEFLISLLCYYHQFANQDLCKEYRSRLFAWKQNQHCPNVSYNILDSNMNGNPLNKTFDNPKTLKYLPFPFFKHYSLNLTIPQYPFSVDRWHRLPYRRYHKNIKHLQKRDNQTQTNHKNSTNACVCVLSLIHI